VIQASSVQAVQRAEQTAMAGLPEGALMQRAAAALAGVLVHELRRCTGGVYGRRVVLLVGPGANGGDALWAGARLARRGAAVQALLTSPATHPGALEGLLGAGGTAVDATDAGRLEPATAALAAADVVVDGLLGIGGRPGLRGAAAALVDRLDPDVPVLAVDLPSGLDPESGCAAGTFVRADLTLTFGAVKPCLLLPPANRAAGRVLVADIGLDPAELGQAVVRRLEDGDVAPAWPVPGPEDDKYSRGVLGVVAGGATYPGAAVLCTGAAVACGAGMVRYLGPGAATDLVRATWPEVVPGPGRVQAWVLGPGVDPADAGQAAAVRTALGGGEPCVVDAGALQVLSQMMAEGAPPAGELLLTPHAGELARLLTDLGEPGGVTRQQVQDDPLLHAGAAARATGATVLLKGATTLVVGRRGVLAQADGAGWLATAGSGDVLAGICGTLLAAGLDPLEAGGLAVLVHARAGDRASNGGPVHAGALVATLPGALSALLGGVRTGRPARRGALRPEL